jgi:hypothetical protein
MAAHADLIEPYILQNFSFDRLPSTVKQVRAVFFLLALEKFCLQIARALHPTVWRAHAMRAARAGKRG